MVRLLILVLCGFGSLLDADELRIASYSPGATQILIDLNCADKIVGASAWCPLPKNHPASRNCDVFNPDLETLILLRPTYVILPRLANPLWANRCKEAGINIVLLSAENRNSAAIDIRSIGQIVQQNELAEKFAQRIESKSKDNQRSLLIIWDGMMAGENSYLENPMKAAGYHSPLVNTAWQKLDWETIAQIKPDVFLWIENNSVNSGITPSPKHLAELKNISAIKNIEGVQKGNVFATTSGSDWLPGTGLIQALGKMRGIALEK